VQSKLDSIPTAKVQTIRAWLRLCNVSTTESVDLSGAIVRYWYTKNTASGTQAVAVYNSGGQVSSSAVKAVSPIRLQADNVVELTLLASLSLAAGTCTADPGISIDVTSPQSSGSQYTMTDDWSYLATPTPTYTNNDHITVSQGTSLLWGTEPSLP
jgi:hypothetical protein